MHADFTDQINTQSWDTDEAFTQRRLAEQCPFTLRKVTTDGNRLIHKNNGNNSLVINKITFTISNIKDNKFTLKLTTEDLTLNQAEM